MSELIEDLQKHAATEVKKSYCNINRDK